MFLFIFYNITVIAYVVFLLWTLMPAFRMEWRSGSGWFRVATGSALIGANFFFPLALPVLIPFYALGEQASEWAIAVILFPRALPKYLFNVLDYPNLQATRIEIKYPIEISGIYYEPRVQVSCTKRRKISVSEYSTKIRSYESVTTASNDDYFALAGKDIIAISHASMICGNNPPSGFQLGPLPNLSGGWPTIYLVRGEAENTKLYSLRYTFHTGATALPKSAAVDDIVFYPPEIVDIRQVPASDMFSLNDMRPTRRKGAHWNHRLAMVTALHHMPKENRFCIQFISAELNSLTNDPNVRHERRPKSLDVSVEQRAAYCRGVLAAHIPQSPEIQLIPVVR